MNSGSAKSVTRPVVQLERAASGAVPWPACEADVVLAFSPARATPVLLVENRT
jgi:hypothetical protein